MSNCVTIYIQAHGFILTGKYISPDISSHSQILSFTGGIGRSGIMKRNCQGVDINPPEGIDIPVIHIDGAQLDVMALSYAQQVYTHINENPTIDENTKSQMSFDAVVRGMPEVYSNCGVVRFPHPKTNTRQIHDDPFVVIPALQDKLYQMYPKEHEDCVNSSECRRNADECELLDKSKQICPYYGVCMVYSTNPEDIPYTLAGEQSQDGNDIIVNLNSEESHYEGTTEYWENKINRHWENKITEEMTTTTKKRLEGERDKIIRLYRKMTLILESYTPTSQKIIMEEKLPEIKLSEILEIFINGMGYDKINIIDPSCDTCQYSFPFKLAAHNILRTVRSNTHDRKRSKTTRGGKKITKKRKSKKRKTRKHK